MARRIVVQVSCDRCGGEVQAEHPVELTYAGVAYRTDLCATHAAELSAALEPFLGVAERIDMRKRAAGAAARPAEGRGPARRPVRRDPLQVAAIRNWARSAGYVISDRGRIPREVEEAYSQRGRKA